MRVTGFIQEAPCLRFIGRQGNVSDHFGEKLEGAFVQEAVRGDLNRLIPIPPPVPGPAVGLRIGGGTIGIAVAELATIPFWTI